MKKVRILCGGYGYNPPGTKTVKPVYAGGTVEVSDEEAERLVALKVAEVVTERPVSGVATPPAGDAGGGAGVNSPAPGNGSTAPETGHLDEEQLRKLTNEQLKQLAIDMGLDPSKCKKKDDYIALITSAEVTPAPASTTEPPAGSTSDDEEDEDEDDGNGEPPPILTQEEPIV